MTDEKTHGLSLAQIQQYREYGFIVLDGLFTQDEAERMRRMAARILSLAINSSLALKQRNPRLDLRLAAGRQVVRKIQPVNDLSNLLTAVSSDSRLIEPLRDILGCEPVLMEEKLNYKQPLLQPVDIETRPDADEFPFHHDWGYYRAQGYPEETLSSAVFLDECTPHNGPMRLVPGSHLRDYPLSEGGAGPTIEEGVFSYQDAIDLVGPPGTAVIFHSKLVHHSPPNPTSSPRRLMIYSHYPATHAMAPDVRNRPNRERAQAFEARYREMIRSGQYADAFRL